MPLLGREYALLTRDYFLAVNLPIYVTRTEGVQALTQNIIVNHLMEFHCFKQIKLVKSLKLYKRQQGLV